MTTRPKAKQIFPRFLIVMFAVTFGALTLTGCSSDIPASFDALTHATPSPGLSDISIDEFLERVTDEMYDRLRDSLVAHLEDGVQVVSHLATLDASGAATPVDTTYFKVGSTDPDVADATWIPDLLPAGQIFLTRRNTEQFVYKMGTHSGSNAIILRAEAMTGQELPGGLQSVTLHLDGESPSQINRIEIERDGGGLFFREKSYLDLNVTGAERQFDALQYNVVLSLPFKGVAAYRTTASVVDSAA